MTSERTDDSSRSPRWKIGALAAGVLIAVSAIIFAVLWFAPVATVKSVELTGVANGDAEAIKEASGVQLGQNMLRVDTDTIARNVAGQPWVSKVTVGRSWPSTIAIDITEHQPALFMRATDGEHLFGTDGKEFTTATPPPGTIELVGAPRINNPADGKLDIEPRVIKSVLTLIDAIGPAVREHIARISAPGPNEITVALHDGHEFFLGSSDNAPEKARAIELVKGREELHWNLSNPQLPTVHKG